VRSSKRKQLEEKLLKLVQPAYQLMLEHIRSGTLDNFKKALNDALNSGQGFAAAAHDCINKFAKLFHDQCEVMLKEALYGPVEARLEGANDDTWPAIRKLLSRETKTAISEFSFALSGFEMDEKDKEDMISKLKNYARGVVEEKTSKEATIVLYGMKERMGLSYVVDAIMGPQSSGKSTLLNHFFHTNFREMDAY
nr:protein root hair defective 3-like [Tanacetum cinerariifolium]